MKLTKIIILPAFALLACWAFTAGADLPPPDLLKPALNDAVLPIAFGGLVVNKANLGIVFTAFKTAFNTGFRTQETFWQRIATLVPSTTSKEEYGWLGQWPRLREWIGDREVKSLELHEYSIKNKKFESTVSVIKDNIEDDSYGIFSPMMQEMGFAAATHPDELIFALLAAGFATTCYDGQYFFDTDHPVGGASVSNMQAGAGNAWFLLDTRRALKPLIFQRRKDYDFKTMNAADDEAVFMRDEYRYGVDARVNVGFGFWQTAFGSKAALDATNFEAAYTAMMSFKSDEARPLGIMPNLLVCGPSSRSAAKAVLDKEYVAGDSNINYQAVDLLVVPWLT